MDQYQVYQKQISEGLSKYRTKRDKQLYKKINHQLDMYRLFLDQNFAAEVKYEWYNQQKKHLNQLKRQKDDIANQNLSSNVVKRLSYIQEGEPLLNPGLQFTKNLQNQISKQLTGVLVGTQKAVQISAYIKVQLNRQIQLLDQVYQQNRDMQSRLNRVKKGLIVILRRAMLNKLTRFLVVLLVLAVIGLIVLYILKGKSII